MPQLRKRSLIIAGHATSVALEPAFWQILEFLAKEKSLSLAALVREVDQSRAEADNLASALRLYVLENLLSRSDLAEFKPS